MIDGVTFRELDVNSDERGHLVEVFREDWGVYEHKPKMSYYSLTHPGVVRAWHRHLKGQVDHFVCPRGKVKVGIYDERSGSDTEGELNTFIIGEQSHEAIRIPGECWHGFKAIGSTESMLLNFPTELYDYDEPDEERIPYDTDRIPLDWDLEPHR
jgi:dTDP-4-dehydrorhamnose 3,5-epimerase